MAEKQDNSEELAAELAALRNDEYLATRTAADLTTPFNIALSLAEKILEEERRKRSER